MCSTGVNSVQISSWEGSGNQDVDRNHIKNMKFDYVEDARLFYLGYARGNGFGIRATNLDYDREGRVLRRKFNTDDDDSLANIFWRDSHSLFEYKCFEDVLVFDTTYKKNAYGKPLVLFVDANNHSATCVFGAALLLDEKFTSYKWTLTKLMDSVGNKHPLSIMTGEDEPMRQAIDEV
ncbi:hypothetical protein Dsin_001210 [Dipteronia sinensis]|uniref:MULE transposase domain-containing protein n=1 Tax=Dipteronia sinensis TaxID=43782 RepID=A0AAE0EII6_9ROSI|nr:hypothetical protein Dsin_001210 [Dipteronia sinensis]